MNLRESPSTTYENFNEKDLLSYGQKRWRRVQYLSDQFFLRWKREYILQQQSRIKWTNPSPNISEGDVVLLKDSTCRNKWPMAIVTKVHPSKDGLVRKVLLRLRSDGSRKPQFRERAVHDVVILVRRSSSVGECHGCAWETSFVFSLSLEFLLSASEPPNYFLASQTSPFLCFHFELLNNIISLG